MLPPPCHHGHKKKYPGHLRLPLTCFYIANHQPSGEGMTRSSEMISVGGPGSTLGFNGERSDLALGHYHLGNGYRLYSPALRRFTAPDHMSPFGQGGINPYAYCAGDPINNTDPTGHMPHLVRDMEDLSEAFALLFTDGTASPEEIALREREHF